MVIKFFLNYLPRQIVIKYQIKIYRAGGISINIATFYYLKGMDDFRQLIAIQNKFT